MDDLIKEVVKKTRLTEVQARAAADAVIAFLTEHLREPAAGMVAEFLAGPGDAEVAESARAKKAKIAAIAATTAAINVTVLPGHS